MNKTTICRLKNIQDKTPAIGATESVSSSRSIRMMLENSKKYLSTGRLVDAEVVATKVLKLEPNNVDALGHLGKSLIKQNRVNEAIEPLSLGVQLAPENPSILVIYASCLRRLKRFDEAINHYRKALTFDAGHQDGLLGLSVALRLSGQEDESQRIASEAIARKPFSIRTGDDPTAPTVLVIKALANLHFIFSERKNGYVIRGGHNTAAALLGSDSTRVNAYIDNFRPDPAWLGNMPTPSVVFNTMSDADALEPRAWELAQKLVDYFAVPVINAPQAVRRTTRDGVYDAIHDVVGLVMPKTCRIKVASAGDLCSGVESAGLRYPIIVRPTGTQTGEGMVVYSSAKGLQSKSKYQPVGEYYAAEFFDFKSADGFWRKTRIFYIGGALVAEHHVAAKDWNIHATNARLLMNQEQFASEEIDFITNFETRMGSQRMAAVRELASRIGLDYFGIDCTLLPDGRLLIFEVNAGMQFKSASQEERPFLLSNRKNISDLFDRLVREKILNQ